MHRVSIFAALTVLLLSPFSLSRGQEAENWGPPKPAPEMKKFERLIGNWEGGGTAVSPNGEMEWTARSTCSWALDGHVFQEDLALDFGPDMPSTFNYRRIIAWDAKTKRFVHFGVDNLGNLQTEGFIAWIDDDTMVATKNTMTNGVPKIERSTVKFDGDAYELRYEEAVGAEAWKQSVSGSLKKAGEGFTFTDAHWESTAMPIPAPPAMARLNRMAGSYSMKGSMSMMPGMPSMDISGNESIRPIFNGHMLKMDVVGDPMPHDPTKFEYRAVAVIGWDSERGCYKEFYVNNMGEVGTQELRFVDDQNLVTATASVEMGQPAAMRGTIRLDETGQITKVSMDRMSATHDADRAFTGEYESTGQEKGMKKKKGMKEEKDMKRKKKDKTEG